MPDMEIMDSLQFPFSAVDGIEGGADMLIKNSALFGQLNTAGVAAEQFGV